MKIRREPAAATLFVCTRGSKKKDGTCKGRGASTLLKTLEREVKRRGLQKHVQVRKTGCLGYCSHGPVVLTCPAREILTAVAKKEAADVVDRLESMLPRNARRSNDYRSVGG